MVRAQTTTVAKIKLQPFTHHSPISPPMMQGQQKIFCISLSMARHCATHHYAIVGTSDGNAHVKEMGDFEPRLISLEDGSNVVKSGKNFMHMHPPPAQYNPLFAKV